MSNVALPPSFVFFFIFIKCFIGSIGIFLTGDHHWFHRTCFFPAAILRGKDSVSHHKIRVFITCAGKNQISDLKYNDLENIGKYFFL